MKEEDRDNLNKAIGLIEAGLGNLVALVLKFDHIDEETRMKICNEEYAISMAKDELLKLLTK